MNRAIFEQWLREEPQSAEQKYLFLVDRFDLSLQICSLGFRSIALLNGEDGISGFYDLDGFLSCLQETEFKGTHRTDFVYVPACSAKKRNDALADYFRSAQLEWREGWKLFHEKEYLEKPESEEKLHGILTQFVERFEGPPESTTESERNDWQDRFHLMGKNGEPSSPLDIAIVEYLMGKIPFFVLGGMPYVYQGGVYRMDPGGAALKSEIEGLLYRRFVRSGTINRIYELLIGRKGVQKQFYELYNAPLHWINFRNGFYDPIRQEMIPHDPKYLAVNQCPFEFHPEEKETVLSGGEVIRRYLGISLPDPVEQQMFWEFAGYCMGTDTQFQKFLILTGEGGTGKSVLIDLIQKLVGEENCSHVSMQDLNRRFYATDLFGKLVNSCGDIPCKAMETTDVLKKAVGEDSLLYEKKGEDAVHFRSHAKLIFSCNGIPENVEDKSSALYRRMMILEMNHIVTTAEKDTRLKEKIAQEMDYAVHMAMSALHDLYERGHFEESTNSLVCLDKARRASDSVRAFIDEMYVCHASGKRIAKTEMYQKYKEYCEDNGRLPLGKAKFVTEMERKGFYLKKYCGEYKFKDTAFADPGFEEMEEGERTPFDAKETQKE